MRDLTTESQLLIDTEDIKIQCNNLGLIYQ